LAPPQDPIGDQLFDATSGALKPLIVDPGTGSTVGGGADGLGPISGPLTALPAPLSPEIPCDVNTVLGL
jgi:hypothetical protein